MHRSHFIIGIVCLLLGASAAHWLGMAGVTRQLAAQSATLKSLMNQTEDTAVALGSATARTLGGPPLNCQCPGIANSAIKPAEGLVDGERVTPKPESAKDAMRPRSAENQRDFAAAAEVVRSAQLTGKWKESDRTKLRELSQSLDQAQFDELGHSLVSAVNAGVLIPDFRGNLF